MITCSLLKRHGYVIIAFRTARNSNISQNFIMSYHIHIRKIRWFLNSEYWPIERFSVNFSKAEFVVVYRNYTDFSPEYIGQKHPCPGFQITHQQCNQCVIDFSCREDSMKSSTVDIKLYIEWQRDFPEYPELSQWNCEKPSIFLSVESCSSGGLHL